MAQHDDGAGTSTAVIYSVEDMTPEDGHAPTILQMRVKEELGGEGSADVTWIHGVEEARRAVIYDLEPGGCFAVSLFDGQFRHLRTESYPNR